MLAVEGIFDGESVKFSEPVNFQKNQRVLVTLVEDSVEKNIRSEDDKKKCLEFLDKQLASKERTNFNADAFIRYERGRATADDIKNLIREGTLKPEDLSDFEKEYFFMEKLLKDVTEKFSNVTKNNSVYEKYVGELRVHA